MAVQKPLVGYKITSSGVMSSSSSSTNSITVSFNASTTQLKKAAKTLRDAVKHLGSTLHVPTGHITWMNRTDINRLLSPLGYHNYVMNRGFTRWGTQARVRWLVSLRKACADAIEQIDVHMLEHYRPEPLDEADRIDATVNGGI